MVSKSVVRLFHSSIGVRLTTISQRTHSGVSHRFLFLIFILLLYFKPTINNIILYAFYTHTCLASVRNINIENQNYHFTLYYILLL